MGDGCNPKLPINLSILEKIFSRICLTSSKHITFWAACLVAFFSFFRKSNLFISDKDKFESGKHLSRHDIHLSNQGTILSITWSKTIQFKERCLLIPLPCIPGSPFCPTQALTLAFALTRQADPQGPAFVYQSRGTIIPLTYESFLSQLHIILQECGLDPARYSGHSFRRGGASFALECGLPADLIQTQGDWRSDAYKRYLDPSLSLRLKVAYTLGSVCGSSHYNGIGER
ncbi:uncharacterized protein LOC132562900 [Ylistrum balloti]|uniref:uncharacterized protein LOC132562900 n=1 Tax=Ylistrum balloti TaxID=509963 RepID=UPI0029058506|nr:uncharacterized protein LOC132562900 [Ylistrum balloti]